MLRADHGASRTRRHVDGKVQSELGPSLLGPGQLMDCGIRKRSLIQRRRSAGPEDIPSSTPLERRSHTPRSLGIYDQWPVDGVGNPALQ